MDHRDARHYPLEAGAVTGAQTRVAGLVDSMLSRAFQLDLSRSDLVKWVSFARRLVLLFFASLVVVAGLLAYISTYQARDLLEESLERQGRAVARAVARAAFVPLTLEDDAALESVASSFHVDANIGFVRIETDGALRAEYVRPGRTGQVSREAQEPIVPLADPLDPGAAAEPIGLVRVGMLSDQIVSQSRSIAVANVALSAAAVAVIAGLGFYLIGHLTQRMRDLVGEARLAEELRIANKELESFSYSVSHDLRAPLRIIDGFSHLLLEDYGPKLDDEGKDLLNRMRLGAQKMGVLIDDLLNLSRITRHEVKRERFDLSAVAQAMADQCRKLEPGRPVNFRCEEGLTVNADPGLMRVVLQNLVANAWKFSRNNPDARIEFGAMEQGGKRVFYVRDNGAGFDMTYANKLFGAFQRLHTESEFPGTGVGLATVQRAVHRQGGRIWAEGAVGQGAVFYFTIEEKGGAR
jgi:signal transduction histidine kinase